VQISKIRILNGICCRACRTRNDQENGEKDTTVPLFHAERMTEALKKVKVPAEIIVVKNAGHGYVFNGSKDAPAEPSPAAVDAAVLKFLDANLKKNAGKGAGQSKPTAMPVKGDAPTSLYGGGAASKDDGVKKQAGDSFRWTGSGQITWNVHVDQAGDYEVALCHRQRVALSSALSRQPSALQTGRSRQGHHR
jgi:hypothetical protein